jgi:hypothetical protein
LGALYGFQSLIFKIGSIRRSKRKKKKQLYSSFNVLENDVMVLTRNCLKIDLAFLVMRLFKVNITFCPSTHSTSFCFFLFFFFFISNKIHRPEHGILVHAAFRCYVLFLIGIKPVARPLFGGKEYFY